MFKLILGVIGITGLLVASGLLMGGGSLLWVDSVLTDEEGFITSESLEAEVDGVALVASVEDIDLGIDSPIELELATLRLRVENQSAGQGIFLGVAPVAPVDDYLEGMPYAVIEEVEEDALTFTHLPATGAPTLEPPGTQTFWIASSAGTGPQELAWDVADGSYSFVVMNEDAADGMSFDAQVGVRIPAIRPISVTLLIAGALVLSVGTILLALAL